MRAALPFLNGGAAGMVATTVIQPVDMIKVRLQLAGEGVKTGPRPTPVSVTRDIIASGKVMDLYTGLSAGLLRQAVYTTARIGFFETFMKALGKRAEDQGRKIGFGERAGAGPTVVRAMALNFGQLAFFSEAKARLQDTSLGPRAQTLTASAVAGFFASFFSLPFDFVKTRLQKQSKGPDGKLPYKGMFDCFGKVMREEGPLRFYRGFSTYYVRIAPHAMVTLIVADYLNFLTK